MDCQHSTSAHALSYSGYHFRYVSILKSSLCPPALFIYKHMHSLHSPCPAPLSYFPESCITCKHGGVTSSCFKISWHFTLPAAWVKSAEVTVSLNSKDFFQCNVWIYAMFLFEIGYFSMSWNVKTCLSHTSRVSSVLRWRFAGWSAGVCFPARPSCSHRLWRLITRVSVCLGKVAAAWSWQLTSGHCRSHDRVTNPMELKLNTCYIRGS
jgi:hypothetical protein